MASLIPSGTGDNTESPSLEEKTNEAIGSTITSTILPPHMVNMLEQQVRKQIAGPGNHSEEETRKLIQEVRDLVCVVVLCVVLCFLSSFRFSAHVYMLPTMV